MKYLAILSLIIIFLHFLVRYINPINIYTITINEDLVGNIKIINYDGDTSKVKVKENKNIYTMHLLKNKKLNRDPLYVEYSTKKGTFSCQISINNEFNDFHIYIENYKITSDSDYVAAVCGKEPHS